MQKMLCACKDELTQHDYLVDHNRFEEGYLCLDCSTFKLLDANGEFDVLKHYKLMKFTASGN